MDRLMRRAQEHGGTSTIIRKQQPSPYNPGIFLPRKSDIVEDWGSACFAHLPGELEGARHMKPDENGVNVFDFSTIQEILFLPSIIDQFQTIEGTATLVKFIDDVFEFMGAEGDASTVLREGWLFDLERSGQWNVAIGIMLRHTREYTTIPWTYCKLRKMGYGIGKALFMAHFVQYSPKDDMWKSFDAPGGHTILCAKSATFDEYANFINWRKYDTGPPIVESAYYRGINNMFGNVRGYSPMEGPCGISYSLRQHVLETQHIRSLGRKLKQRGKPYEVPNRKPRAVRGGVEPEARMDDELGRVALRPGGVIYGGIGCGPLDVPIEAPPLDIEQFVPRFGRAKAIPGSE